MNILGGKHSGHASLASDVSFLKKSMLGVVGKLRDRLRTVTAMDERLELTTSMALGTLEGEVRKLSVATNNDLNIITSLLGLIGHLLGYDWLDGEIHRHVVFFRDNSQAPNWRSCLTNSLGQ